MIRALLLAASLRPEAASHVAALAVGRPELGPRLVRICRRESRCQPIGIHDIDARLGRAAWRNAVRAGALDPAGCPWHRRGAPSRWSTRGSWGTMAAFTLRYLGGCLPPWVLDIPLVGALAAALRLDAARSSRVPALRRWARAGH